jgi:hypothetical protein
MNEGVKSLGCLFVLYLNQNRDDEISRKQNKEAISMLKEIAQKDNIYQKERSC